MATRTDFDRLVGGLGEDQQKYMQNWLQSNNPTQGQMDNFANNPGGFLTGIGWTGGSTKPTQTQTTQQSNNTDMTTQPGGDALSGQPQPPWDWSGRPAVMGNDGIEYWNPATASYYIYNNGQWVPQGTRTNTYDPNNVQVFTGGRVDVPITQYTFNGGAIGSQQPGTQSAGGISAGNSVEVSPFVNLFQSGFNSKVGDSNYMPFFDFNADGTINFNDFTQFGNRMKEGLPLFVSEQGYQGPGAIGPDAVLQNIINAGGVGANQQLTDIINSGGIGYQGPSSIGYVGPESIGYQGPSSIGYSGPSSIDLTNDLQTMLGIDKGGLGTTLSNLGAGQTDILNNLGLLLDPTSGVIPTINDLLGGDSAIQTDISGIGDRLGTIEGLLNQTPDYQPFIEDFWGGLRDLMSEMPEGATFTPGEGGSIVVDPGNGGEPFEFTPPEMGDIVDNRAVFRDSLNDLLLGNTGANNLLADRYVSALDAPNPYAEVQDSVLGEIMRQIDADAEQGRERLLNQYAVTNKLDMPVFKEQLQDYEGDVLNAKGNARINFGLQQAGAEEGIRRGRLQDLSGYQQQNVVNLAEALRNSITERAGEVGLQQNVYNNALQNFLNTVNQNNAVTTTQYGFTDDGTRMALGLLGNGMGQSAATGAANIFGNIQNNNDAGFNNFLNLLMQFDR